MSRLFELVLRYIVEPPLEDHQRQAGQARRQAQVLDPLLLATGLPSEEWQRILINNREELRILLGLNVVSARRLIAEPHLAAAPYLSVAAALDLGLTPCAWSFVVESVKAAPKNPDAIAVGAHHRVLKVIPLLVFRTERGPLVIPMPPADVPRGAALNPLNVAPFAVAALLAARGRLAGCPPFAGVADDLLRLPVLLPEVKAIEPDAPAYTGEPVATGDVPKAMVMLETAEDVNWIALREPPRTRLADLMLPQHFGVGSPIAVPGDALEITHHQLVNEPRSAIVRIGGSGMRIADYITNIPNDGPSAATLRCVFEAITRGGGYPWGYAPQVQHLPRVFAQMRIPVDADVLIWTALCNFRHLVRRLDVDPTWLIGDAVK
jgi:hypothetical protein